MTTTTKGLIMVYTGDGKGKTTAALGLTLRAVGHGHKVCIIQFMKGDPSYGELQAIAKYLPMVRIEPTGTSDFVDRDNPSPIDLSEAQRGFDMAVAALDGSYDLVILDEVNVAMDFGLISIEALIALLKKKPPQVHVVCTGRGVPESLREMADLISEVKDIKHHYYQGVQAQAGIEH